MKYTFNINSKINSAFVKEAYFPAIIEFSSEELNNHFIEFNYKDTDMFELSVTPDTKVLKRFTLTLCNHFSIEDHALTIPDYETGVLSIEGPAKTECDTFSVEVYSDGLLIKISTAVAEKFLKCGQLIFGITAHEEVATIHITDLSNKDIAHVKYELSA